MMIIFPDGVTNGCNWRDSFRNDYDAAKSCREKMLDFLSHMELKYSLDFDMFLFGHKSLGMLNQK